MGQPRDLDTPSPPTQDHGEHDAPEMHDASEATRGSASTAPSRSFNRLVRTPAYVQVVEQLRNAVTEGRLAPGESLPTERELVESFGVSRATIREAVRTLEAQGLLTSRRTVVSEAPTSMSNVFLELLRVQQISVFDLVYYRGMLEREAIALVAPDPQDVDWDRAHEALDEMANAGDSIERFVEAYLSFHLHLVRSAENEVMSLTMRAAQDALREHFNEGFRQVIGTDEAPISLERIHQLHVELLEALETSDIDRASTLLSEHLEDFYTQLLKAHAPTPGSTHGS